MDLNSIESLELKFLNKSKKTKDNTNRKLNILLVLNHFSTMIYVDRAFHDALKAQSGGCSLESMVHFIAAVVSIVGAIYTLGTSASVAVGAVSTIINGLKAADTFEKLKTALSEDGIITQGIDDIIRDMNKIENNF